MSKLCFFMGVYQEWGLAATVLQSLREYHPQSSIICYSDGHYNQEFHALCNRFNAQFSVADRCKTLINGAKWLERMVTAMLGVTADIYFRVEPDTLILGTFDKFPKADLFGNIRSNKSFDYVQGGCVGITRQALSKFFESRIFQNREYCGHQFGYPRYLAPYRQPGEGSSGEWLLATDIALSHAAHQLNLQLKEWERCKCFTTEKELLEAIAPSRPHQLVGKFVAVHPVKQ